jgi:class 3 adenylate cyclase
MPEATELEQPTATRGLWSRLTRQAGPEHDAVCGKCAYVVTSLPTFVCPECGSDLREVGIVRRNRPGRKARLRWRDVPKAIRRKYDRRIWVMALVAVVLSRYSVYAVSWSWDRPAWGFTSRSVSYNGASIEAPFLSLQLLGMRFAREPKDLQITLRMKGTDGAEHATYVDLPALRMLYWYRPASGGVVQRSDSAFDEAALLRWMEREVHANVNEPAVIAEARALAAALKRYDGRTPAHPDVLFEGLLQHLVNAAGPWSGPFKASWSTLPRTIGAPWGSMLFGLALVFGPYIVLSGWQRRKGMVEGKAALIAEGLWEELLADGGIAESRTLTVLFSDMKDFTVRAASASRADLLRLLRANRRVVEKGVARFGGTVVKIAGDGVVAKFESATNAVLAGLEVQRLAKLHNLTAAAEEMLELRVAVSTGEVTLERNDVYGPAVNIAARLQAITPVGEVYLTDATRQSATDSEMRTEAMEAVDLKGVKGSTAVHRAVPRES